LGLEKVVHASLDTSYVPVTAVMNPLTTPPSPLLTKALIMVAQAQIPTRAAMVKPVARANFEVSYPRLILVSVLVSVVVFMVFSFIWLNGGCFLSLFHCSLSSIKHE
jgi:hypothetical protein